MAKQVKKIVKPALQPLPEENKWFVYGMLAAFLVLVFFAVSYKLSGDDDFFWHLATGKYIVENKVVPDKDIFGYTSAGDEWIPFEWGWDVLTYGLNSLGGDNAILAFRSIAFCVIFYLYFNLFQKFKINSVISVVVLFCLLVGVMDRFSPRPHIITYIFFACILHILLSYKYIDREKYKKRLYFLPLIFLVWGNTHMGVLAGGLFLFVFFVSELIFFYSSANRQSSSGVSQIIDKKQLQVLFGLSVACALMLLLNPHGIRTYEYAYSHTQMKMLETINEWRSPFTSVLDFGFVNTFFKAFLYSGLIVLLYSYLKKDVLFALVTIAFVIYSVRAVRFTVDYEFVMIFFIAYSLNFFYEKVKGKGKTILGLAGHHNAPKVVLAAAFLYLALQVSGTAIYESIKYYRVPGWGINEEFMPVKMIDFIRQNNIRGTVFNHFGTGGYLVWSMPGEKNFIDSRNLNDRLFNEYESILHMRPGFEKKLESYGVDYVMYLDPDLIRRPNELSTVVTAYLYRNPGWKLVFWDDKSLLFVKDIPKFADVISKYEFKIFNPYTALFDKQEFEKRIKSDPNRTNEEIKRKTDSEPKGQLSDGMKNIALNYLKGK